MSYATSLLMAYPPPYGPSTLLSDDLVQRSSLGAYYEPSVPYMSTSRLRSDDLAYNQLGLGPTSYRSSAYSNFPSTNYPHWQREIPGQSSYTPLYNVREYSESIGTTSNTNTASSIARSIDENNFNGTTTTTTTITNVFPNYQQNYNHVDRSPHLTTIWSPTGPKILKNDEKPTPTHRSLPELSATIVQKKSPIEELKKDTTPIPSPPSPPPALPASPPVLTKQESNLQRNPTLIEPEKQRPSVDIQAWLTETKTETPKDEKPAEQAWTIKIDQLHTIQAQREKEKAKTSRTLPSITKKVDNKPRITSFQRRDDSYFDSLFDGNYYRKTSTNQQNLNSSYLRNKSTGNIFTKPKTTILSKYVSPRKVPPCEPPTNTTTSWKKPAPKPNQNPSVTPRGENIHLNTDERFREALQKFRSDRAEQKQKEITESTAKRLNYGDYVRRLTKDGSLHNIIKPSPWSDFLDTKKGHVYSLTKEEKKDLYNQSRSYGERVRYRNFALFHGDETRRSPHRSIHFPIQNQEPESGDETSHEPVNDDDNDSNSTIKTTNKTYIKQPNHNGMISDRSGRSTKHTDQSSSTSEASEEDVSDFESSRRQKKKYYDSSVQTTTATDDIENDETSEQQSTRMRNQDTDDDLFTVREEKTLESLEGARYKKR